MAKNRIVLASASPRRREILEMAGYEVEILIPVVEEIKGGMKPEDLVLNNAKLKAEAAEKLCDGIVIAADTVVCLEGEILGKGRDAEGSRAMLRGLSGKTHTVYTGWSVCGITADGKKIEVCDVAASDVTMREITNEEIEGYIKTGSPFDKAGAYGIQDAGGMFVSSICGDYYTVMGLPLCKISKVLRDNFGIGPFETI